MSLDPLKITIEVDPPQPETADQRTRRLMGCHRCGAIGLQFFACGPDGYRHGCQACGYEVVVKVRPVEVNP